MHNTISYSGRPERDAVLDLVEWLGFRRARLLAREVRRGLSFGKFTLLCGFAGVEGFPVIAAFKHFGGRS